jgi:lactoylglutathione lyase
MTLGSISATVLFVQDLNKCMTFYRDIVGLPITFNDDVSYGFRLGTNQDLVVLQVSAAAEMVGEEAISLHPGVNHTVLLCVEAKDIDATHKELTAKGLNFIRPPKNQAWGRRTAYFADPEGHLWELWQEIKA